MVEILLKGGTRVAGAFTQQHLFPEEVEIMEATWSFNGRPIGRRLCKGALTTNGSPVPQESNAK